MAQGGRGRSGPEERAFRTEHVTRSTCRAVSEYGVRQARRMGGKVYGGSKRTLSPVYEGLLKAEMDAAVTRYPDVVYRPLLIDATYAGLVSGFSETPLVVLALNRDGDCLSDLVMAMFGRSPVRNPCCWPSTRTIGRPSRWPRRPTAPRRRFWARTWPTRWRCC